MFKIQSITKKIFIALLGGFLLLFLLFHAVANLCILRHDGGTWYSDFCHFMGTNYIVKVFEIILLAAFVCHIVFTIVITIQNRGKRPVPYKVASKTKTATGSKFMIWTGLLIVVGLGVHFVDFYFVKHGFVKGNYMVESKSIQSEELSSLAAAVYQSGLTPDEFIISYEEQLETMSAEFPPEQYNEAKANIEDLKALVPVLNFMTTLTNDDFSDDGERIYNVSFENKEILEAAIADVEIEPDFYYMTREKFQKPRYVIIYLIFFVVLWFHMRHAFQSMFQTLGLVNYKYYPAIDMAAKIYAVVVCLMFVAVVVGVFVGL